MANRSYEKSSTRERVKHRAMRGVFCRAMVAAPIGTIRGACFAYRSLNFPASLEAGAIWMSKKSARFLGSDEREIQRIRHGKVLYAGPGANTRTRTGSGDPDEKGQGGLRLDRRLAWKTGPSSRK